MIALETKFHKAMLDINVRVKKEINYNPSRFIQLVSERGGLAAAKQLIKVDGGTSGFTTLWEHNRLDLSVEAHVIKPEYRNLFTEEEIEICRNRLTEYGYSFDK